MITIKEGRYNSQVLIVGGSYAGQMVHVPTGEGVLRSSLQAQRSAAGRGPVLVLTTEGGRRVFCILKDGRVRFGCCTFTKAASRRILRWLSP